MREKNKINYYVEPQPLLFLNNKHVTASTLNDIVENLIFSKEYRLIIDNICQSSLADELQQEMGLYFLQYPDLSKLQEMILRGEFKFFFAHSVYHQWNSPRSSFYINYRRGFYQNQEFNSDKYDSNDDFEEKYNRIKKEIQQDNVLTKIKEEVEKLGWYEHKIWEMHSEQKLSIPKISKLTGISMDSLYKTINSIKKLLQEKIKY